MQNKNNQTNFDEYFLFILLLVVDLIIFYTNTNVFLFHKVNSLNIYLPDKIMRLFNYVASSYNYVLIVLLPTITILFKPKKIFRVIVALALYYIVVSLIKNNAHVARPYMVLDQGTFYFLKEKYNYMADGYHSFPSGHTSLMSVFIFSINTLFFRNNIYMRLLLILLIFLTAIIRIASGFHWPIDVITGILIGYLIVKVSFNTLNSK